MKVRSNFLLNTILIFLGWVVIMNVFGLVAGNRLNLTTDTAYEWMIPPEQFTPIKPGLTEMHSRWDSLWYLDIAENGYNYKGPNSLSNIVFFPMYPTLIRLASIVMDPILGGVLVSLIALFGALYLLGRLVKEHHPGVDPHEVQFALLAFPTAFFLQAVYTESIFLLFSVASIYMGLKRNFWAAGLFGAMAALTRVTGVLLFVPLIIEYAIAFKQEKRKLNWDILGLALIPLAAASFFVFHWVQFGDPTIFFSVQDTWGRGFELEQKHFLVQTLPAGVNLGLDLFFVAIGLLSCALVWKQLRRYSYVAYTALAVFVPLATGTTMSIGRYLIVIFPIFIAFASIKNPQMKRLLMLLSILLLALYTVLFVTNYWAG